MNPDEDKRQEYFRRIRRLKRILRPLPRRTNVHRYPVLKWFSNTARRRAHLWSFRREDIIPSLYVGSIAGMLPMPAPQIPICFVIALLLRCNLVIAAALTLISNPFTFIPLYLAANWVGRLVMGTFWHPSLEDEITPEMIEIVAEQTGNNLPSLKFLQWYGETVLGGVLLGAVIGALLHAFYKVIVNYSRKRRAEHGFGLLGRFRQHGEQAAATPVASLLPQSPADAVAAEAGQRTASTHHLSPVTPPEDVQPPKGVQSPPIPPENIRR